MSPSGSLDVLQGWIAGVMEVNALLGYGGIALQQQRILRLQGEHR
ncbi:MAG: hypothetical protein VKJ66_10845 [Synechococcus sp.]|nr:hypothetical protein [Synechococcus sp.]